jgi:uncharacterized protein (TIGR02145 family)
MKSICLSVIAMLFLAPGYGQSSIIELRFTAVNVSSAITTDSIFIRNLTRSCDTVLYWPDTTLHYDYTSGLEQSSQQPSALSIQINYPDPASGETQLKVFIPRTGEYDFCLTNISGKTIDKDIHHLAPGYHRLLITPGTCGVSVFTISDAYHSHRSVKIISSLHRGPIESEIIYQGSAGTPDDIKNNESTSKFAYLPGDRLLVAGYSDSLQSGLWVAPANDTLYILQFARNIPCPGMETLVYSGQTYHTIQVLGQCWMKENLNYGTMLVSPQAQTNNLVVEKYCMGDVAQYCDSIFGGLYSWNEMMGYVYDEGGQGICPDGWHIPGEIDWQILEGSVDSDRGITDPVWATNGWRGSDAGGRLKQTGNTLWEPPNTGATDAFGFCLIPAGYYVQNAFWGPGYKAYFWSSAVPYKYFRNMDWNSAEVQRNTGSGSPAFSVRCLRDQ